MLNKTGLQLQATCSNKSEWCVRKKQLSAAGKKKKPPASTRNPGPGPPGPRLRPRGVGPSQQLALLALVILESARPNRGVALDHRALVRPDLPHFLVPRETLVHAMHEPDLTLYSSTFDEC